MEELNNYMTANIIVPDSLKHLQEKQKELEIFIGERNREINEMIGYFSGLGPSYGGRYLNERRNLILNHIKIKPDLEEKIVDNFVVIIGDEVPYYPNTDRCFKNKKYIFDAIEAVVDYEFDKAESASQVYYRLKNIFGEKAIGDKRVIEFNEETRLNESSKKSLCDRLESLYENFEDEGSIAHQKWQNSAVMFFPVVENAWFSYLKDINTLPRRIKRRTRLSKTPEEMFMEEAQEIKDKYMLKFQTTLVKELFKDINKSQQNL